MSTSQKVCPANGRFFIVTGPDNPVPVQEERLRDAANQGAAPRLHPGIRSPHLPAARRSTSCSKLGIGRDLCLQHELPDPRRRRAVPSTYSSNRLTPPPQIFVMKPTDARNLHHPSLSRWLHTARLGRVLAQQ